MLLGVNIDHIATLRNARGEKEPSVLQAAQICVNAGADGLTTHLREDRRHIMDADVFNIKNNIDCRLNLEMAVTDEMHDIALKLLPNSCCLVPEKRQEITTEGGLDVVSQKEKMKFFVSSLIDKGINVSLFIDPVEEQITAAKYVNANYIELHTGSFSRAYGTEKENDEFNKLKQAAKYAQSLGLIVNAGHGLNYVNVHKMHEIDGLNELNIGHSIISKALFIGLDSAVKEMLTLVNKS